jgi:CRISPR-associated endonuclease/helicase Cas3
VLAPEEQRFAKVTVESALTTYFAHSTTDPSHKDWQVLKDHLHAVGELAADFARPFGAEHAARLAGLLHDLGKYTKGFQARLEGGKRVDHATAGAFEIRRLARTQDERMLAEIIAYGIAGHHAGLPNNTGGASLADRLEDFPSREPLDLVWHSEIAPNIEGIVPHLKFEKTRLAFQFGVLGRMIFSCLVDADYRDTESFYAKIETRQIDRRWPKLGERIDTLLAAFDAHMADIHTNARDTPINALRRDILTHVRAKAALPPGLFTLTVPTGGGKTLASLGFALDHAKHHGLERIIYAIPFTAIIDQTAGIFRRVLGDEVLLEHHSAIDEERNERRESRDKLKLAMEDWAAPVVVTTNVQLFESLFADRPSRCRKLHNIARSVIILDEAQTIPLALLRPSVAMLDELARNYGVTVVLCTATQPALGAPEFEGGLTLAPDRELAPDPHNLARVLRRVRIRHAGEMDDSALVAALSDHERGLVIVNSRAHALNLFRMAKDAGLAGVVHLTTRQCAAHRRIILAGVREKLLKKRPCRLIATSLVEAGVDLDFPRVWRAETGLDQIAQAAGRCNREGRRSTDDSIVTVFHAPANSPPHEIKQFADAFARMAGKYEDWLSPDALRAYFQEIYWTKGKALDARDILAHFQADATGTDFAYRSVAEKFRMIESGLEPVIIGWDQTARDAVGRLVVPGVRPGGIARALQPYVVQVPPNARTLLIRNGHVTFAGEREFADQFAVLRTPSLYTEVTGLLWNEAGYLLAEDMII